MRAALQRSMNTQAPSPKRILWALDPFEDLPELWKEAERTFKGLAAHQKLDIEPVFVLNGELGASAEHQVAARKAMDHALARVKIDSLREPHVVIEPGHSLHGGIDAVLRRAKVFKCDWIAVGSHGRKGLARAILGSFAEALILKAECPVLVMVPRGGEKKSTVWSSVLMPTDLRDLDSRLSAEAFAVARELKVDVTLLHVKPPHGEQLLRAGAQLLAGGVVTEPPHLAHDHPTVRAQLQKAIDTYGAGVATTLRIDDTSPSAAEAIVSYARNHPVALIVMATRTDALTSALIGSVTRRVLREAPCPVLVFRPEAWKSYVTLF